MVVMRSVALAFVVAVWGCGGSRRLSASRLGTMAVSGRAAGAVRKAGRE